MADIGNGFVRIGGEILTAAEWAARFKAHMIAQAELLPEHHHVADSECESAMESGEWVNENPEESANEAMSYWDNDGDV